MSEYPLWDAVESVLRELDKLTRKASPWDESSEIIFGDVGWYIRGAPFGEWPDTEQGKVDAQWTRAVANPYKVLNGLREDWLILESHRPDDNGDCTVDRWGYATIKFPCAAFKSLARRHGLQFKG